MPGQAEEAPPGRTCSMPTQRSPDHAGGPARLEPAVTAARSGCPTGRPAANLQRFSPPLPDPSPFPLHRGHDPTPPPGCHKPSQALAQLLGCLPDFPSPPVSFSKV